ncbi:MAG: BON domain-containing protein, partial [Burkholderiales bacterium]|nr:BON domain-containing protein [Burkholderiales bacterium]
DITIDSEQGRVTLRGIVFDAGERLATQEVAAGVPGVAEVDNQLRLMTPTRRFTTSKT